MAGLYIHIPFCAKKCKYCNFYSAFTEASVVDDYLKALNREIERWGSSLGCPVDTVYIGGGTPSVLGRKIVPIVDKIRSCFSLTSDCEITAEANPAENGKEFLKAARYCGINRLSIGAQSGIDSELRLLGRTHTADDTKRFVEQARKTGFDNISLDLMLALPGANDRSLLKSLDFLSCLSPEHISAYILKVEDKTAFKADKSLRFADEDEQARQYLFACEYLEKQGFLHYEISNFARPGRQSRHNLKYWHCEEYLGIGPSAHSYLNGRRFFYESDIKSFIEGTKTVPDGAGGTKEEFFMLNLRLSDGVDLKEFEKRFGACVTSSFRDFSKKLAQSGLMSAEKDKIHLTDRGMLLSNTIITELLERLL